MASPQLKPAIRTPAAPPGRRLLGLLTEWPDPAALVDAVRATRAAGYRRLEVIGSFPLEGLERNLGLPRGPGLVRAGALAGGIGAGVLGLWLHWQVPPSFLPFLPDLAPLAPWLGRALSVMGPGLLGALAGALLGSLVHRPPRLRWLLFAADHLLLGRGDHHFLCIDAADPLFDRRRTAAYLVSLGATRVVEVPK